VFAKTLGLTDLELTKHPSRKYAVGDISQRKYGPEGLRQVFADPRATRAVFVREPLTRFVSAFIDKCTRFTSGMVSGNCPFHSNVFSDAIEWALKTDMSDVNPHWLPQAYHCHLHKYVGAYTVIGVMDKTTNPNQFHSDVACLLEEVGLGQFNVLSNHDSPHCPKCSQNSSEYLSETDILTRLFTPSTARALIKRLQIDYHTFGFPEEPAWVAAATGEWHSVAAQAESIEMSRRKWFSMSEMWDARV